MKILETPMNTLDKIQSSLKQYCNETFDFSFNPEKPIIRLHEPTFGFDEINAALLTLLSTKVTMGEKVKAFEKQFVNYLNG